MARSRMTRACALRNTLTISSSVSNRASVPQIRFWLASASGPRKKYPRSVLQCEWQSNSRSGRASDIIVRPFGLGKPRNSELGLSKTAVEQAARLAFPAEIGDFGEAAFVDQLDQHANAEIRMEPSLEMSLQALLARRILANLDPHRHLVAQYA